MITLKGSSSSTLIYTSQAFDHSPYNNNAGFNYTINHNFGVEPNLLNCQVLDANGFWMQHDDYVFTGGNSYGWEQVSGGLNTAVVGMYRFTSGQGTWVRFILYKI
jgi:hypothetical protein